MPTILITGANRGLGLEFVRQYLAEDYRVIATCRAPDDAAKLSELKTIHSQLDIIAMDLSDFATIESAALSIGDQPIEILLNNAGVFGPKPKANGDMRQNFGHLDYQLWEQMLRVNTMAPMKVAEVFLSNLMAGDEKKIISITSQLASIAEGEVGLYLYRTTKTALNMAMATLARNLDASGAIVALLNPGWVKTDMGGATAAMEVDQSIRAMRQVIAALSSEDSGAFIDYDGRRIPW